MFLVPEPGVSRGPFELMLFVQVDSKVVSPGEALITNMALVPSYEIPLMLSFMVNLHGDECARGEATGGNITVKSWLAAVCVQVFAQINQVLAAVFAVFTAVWFLIAVAELDVVAQCRGGRTGHVTQWAFVVAHVGSHVISQESFCCKPFGTVRTLEPLTFHGTLSYNMVKELGVVSIHPPATWTCHYLLLCVAAQVLSQFRTSFSCGFTIFPSAV